MSPLEKLLLEASRPIDGPAGEKGKLSLQSALAPINRSVLSFAGLSPVLPNFSRTVLVAYRSPLQDFAKSVRSSALQDFHRAALGQPIDHPSIADDGCYARWKMLPKQLNRCLS